LQFLEAPDQDLRSSRAVVCNVFEDAKAVSRQSFLNAIATLAMLLAPMIDAVLLDSLGWRATSGSILNGLLARRLSAAVLERLEPALLGIALVLVCTLEPAIPRMPVLVCVLAASTFATGLVASNAIAAGLAPLRKAAGAAAAFIGSSQMIVGAVVRSRCRTGAPGYGHRHGRCHGSVRIGSA